MNLLFVTVLLVCVVFTFGNAEYDFDDTEDDGTGEDESGGGPEKFFEEYYKEINGQPNIYFNGK